MWPNRAISRYTPRFERRHCRNNVHIFIEVNLTITYQQMFTIILIELCLDLRTRWWFSMRRFLSDIATISLSQATLRASFPCRIVIEH